ncbi:MAG: hypothetical protein HFJ65_06415 [Eggerthellaceae bacterium]|nr:hypothetical protein [Eggerthellaceae bacterium]
MPNENAPYEFQDEGNTSTHKKSFVVWIVIAAIAVILALLVGLYFFMDSTQYKGDAGELGQLDGKTAEEIQAELDRYVEDGMLSINIAAAVRFEDGTSEGELRIENSPANHYLMQVDIARDDTGEVIYSSDAIEPNYHIQYGRLNTDLPAGTYPCTATFYALNMDTREIEGQAGANVTIIVEN